MREFLFHSVCDYENRKEMRDSVVEKRGKQSGIFFLCWMKEEGSEEKNESLTGWFTNKRYKAILLKFPFSSLALHCTRKKEKVEKKANKIEYSTVVVALCWKVWAKVSNTFMLDVMKEYENEFDSYCKSKLIVSIMTKRERRKVGRNTKK